mmetsp:Transcript_33948/g.81443  ORF Transcript_33948/g.81443 Transcript_33948/m.81443 type:complete len:369 (-) Transcript_33948:14-1120(-)
MSPLNMASMARAPSLLGSMSSSTSSAEAASPTPSCLPAALLYLDCNLRMTSSASPSPSASTWASAAFTRLSTAFATCSFRRSASFAEDELPDDLDRDRWRCRRELRRPELRLRLRRRLWLRLRERLTTAAFFARQPPPLGPPGTLLARPPVTPVRALSSFSRRSGASPPWSLSLLGSLRFCMCFLQSFFPAQGVPTHKCFGMELALADSGTGRLDSSPRRNGLYSFSLTFAFSGSGFSLSSFKRSLPIEPKKSTSAAASSLSCSASFGSGSSASSSLSAPVRVRFFCSFFCSFRFSFFLSFLLFTFSSLSSFSSLSFDLPKDRPASMVFSRSHTSFWIGPQVQCGGQHHSSQRCAGAWLQRGYNAAMV